MFFFLMGEGPEVHSGCGTPHPRATGRAGVVPARGLQSPGCQREVSLPAPPTAAVCRCRTWPGPGHS